MSRAIDQYQRDAKHDNSRICYDRDGNVTAWTDQAGTVHLPPVRFVQQVPADEQTIERNTVPGVGIPPAERAYLYTCQCCHCGALFFDSNKRAVGCKDCKVPAPTQDLTEQGREMPMPALIALAIAIVVAGAIATALVCLHLLRTEIPAPAAHTIEIDLHHPPAGGDWSMFAVDTLPPVR